MTITNNTDFSRGIHESYNRDIMKKKILFICVHSPFETGGGGAQRTRLLFQALCTVGHVDLVCFSSSPAPQGKKSENYSVLFSAEVRQKSFSHKQSLFNKLRFWSPCSIYPLDRAAARIVEKILSENAYDHIVIRYMQTAFQCGLYRRNNLIIDVDDSPWQVFRSYAFDRQLRLRKRISYFYSYVVSGFYIPGFCKRSFHLFFSNKKQATYDNSSYLPNIPLTDHIDFNRRTIIPQNKTILFVGNMKYGPNLLGLDRFIQHVWKDIIQAVPDARFRIIGQGIPDQKRDRWNRIKGIEIAGFVEDLSSEYLNCHIVVAPIYHGGGTNIKVLEAMMANRSCVITTFAARGFEDILINRENIIIVDDYSDFSAAVIELLTDSALNAYIGKNAAGTIDNYLSGDIFLSNVTAVFNNSR